MKKLQKISLISLIMIIVMSCIIFVDAKNIRICYADNEHFEIVMERSSKRVLLSSGANVKRPMASTTKILTALCAIENGNLEDEVEIDDKAVGVEGSSIYLQYGEKLKLVDLLYGLMLRSGNDAATAIAIHISGSVDIFAELMNKTAARLGAVNSHFSNPHGLSNENHYTTCYDLALITCHALDNPIFRKIVSTKRYSCKNSDGYLRVMYNKNKMLTSFDGADGVKTGYTKEAGRCLVSSATRDGMQLVSVVLNCGPMFERSCEILDDCFSRFSLEKIAKGNKKIGDVSVKLSSGIDAKVGYMLERDLFLPLEENEKKDLLVTFDVPKSVDFPIFKGDKVGNVCVYSGNNLIYSEKLFIMTTKNKFTFGESLKLVAENW